VHPIEWVLVAVVVVGVGAAILGADRYRGRRKTGGESAAPTDEVFIDPESGKQMRVWYDPKTGERDYRPD
jgi:hypothetical protein